MPTDPVTVLLVEDNPADAHLLRLSLSERTRACLEVATDGEQALERLRHRSAEGVRPSLVILDLNLPRKDGREVLREMRSDPELRRVPVVILTHSVDPTDVDAAYDEFASCYVVKPMELDAFRDTVASIERFWLGTATLPRR